MPMEIFLWLKSHAASHWPFWLLAVFCWALLFTLLDFRRRNASGWKPRIPAFKMKHPKGRAEARPNVGAKAGSGFEASPSFASLVTACLGNREQAKRLAAFELKRNPLLSPNEAVCAALDRLYSDRQR